MNKLNSFNPAFDEEGKLENGETAVMEKLTPKRPQQSDSSVSTPTTNSAHSGRCGIFTRYRTTTILTSAILGGLTGYLLGTSGEDVGEIVSWIGLPGDLFIRALKCIVVPLVFVNVVLAVIQMMDVGKAVSIGKTTIGLYAMTTFVAACEGLAAVLIFQGYFVYEQQPQPSGSVFSLMCDAPDTFVYEDPNSDFALKCMNSEENMNATLREFPVVDLYNGFVKTQGIKNDLSFSQTLQDGIFRKLVSDNIVGDFVNASFASIIVFAVVFAVAIHRVADKKNGVSMVLDLFRELEEIFMQLINWIILFTPFAVFSLVCGAIGSNSNIETVFQNIGVMALATLVGMLAHVVITHWGIFFLITKMNPWKYMANLIPAQMFAFACASSAATIPVTMQAVKATKKVPDTIRNFVVPLGATINMDGGAIAFPVAIVFLAIASGREDQLNASTYVLMIIIAAIGSAGAAPIPASGLVLILTAYNTVFDATGTPEAFALVVAIDFLIDRMATALNVTGDMMVCGMVSHLTKSSEWEVLDERKYSQVEETMEHDTHRRMSLYENDEE